MAKDKVRVRFAPSPTGSLHLGGVRTALYNYLYARHHQGEFVLRVEDTDTARSTEASLKTQLADLNWLGLHWNEGPDAETLVEQGKLGPYRQSQRKEIYDKYVRQLLAEDRAYYCFLTDDEIAMQKEQAKQQGSVYQTKSPYATWSKTQIDEKLATGAEATVRFRVPMASQNYHFQDLVRGNVILPSHMVGDFVILRSDGMPVYNFCCVVDDALMQITHVFRGEEHLSNTLRQLMLYEALAFDVPQFAHLSVILGQNRKKLSKRDEAVSCEDFRKQGYLPEAILNYVALLGWSDPKGQELLHLEDMITRFSTDRLNAAAPIFDDTKMKWVNAHHIRSLSKGEQWLWVRKFLQQKNMNFDDRSQVWIDKSLELFIPEIETWQDIIACYQPLTDNFSLHEEAKDVLAWESSKQLLQAWLAYLQTQTFDYLTVEQFSNQLDKLKLDLHLKGKYLFMPFRVTMIGKAHGADLKQLAQLLSRRQLQARAEHCLQYC